jgi:hypothetical protein
LEIAKNLDMGDAILIRESQTLSDEIGKMLYAMLEKLRSKAEARPA